MHAAGLGDEHTIAGSGHQAHTVHPFAGQAAHGNPYRIRAQAAVHVVDNGVWLVQLGPGQGHLAAVGDEPHLGAEGKRQAVAALTSFDLVILDLTVRGGMGAGKTLTELRKIDPEIAVIISSGYGDALLPADAEGGGAVATLPKPYTLDELLRSVRAAIARV